MSFLAADDPLLEADGTLEAALAFLDDYSGVREDEEGLSCLGLTSEGSCGSPPSGTPSVSPRSPSTDSTQGTEDGDARSARRSSLGESTQRKIKRSNAPAAMRLRRKRKAERLLLREQAAQLEALLRRLRQARGPNRTQPKLAAPRRTGAASAVETVDDGGFVRWADVATQIQRERQQAEVENVQLREILGKQVKLARSLEGLLQKRGVFQGIDLVFQPPRPTRSPSPFADFNTKSMLEDLEEKIQALYADIGSMVSASPEDVMTSHFSMKQRPGSGDLFMEVTTTTPLACSYEEALNITPGGVRLKESLSNKQLIHHRFDEDKISEKTFMVLLRDDHHDVNLRGVCVMRKFTSDDHVVYICTSIVRPALEGDLQFREIGWIKLTRSLTDPQHASTFRMSYQVHPERRGRPSELTSAPFHQLGHLERFVLNSYGRSTRTLLQRVQESLLDELDRHTHARTSTATVTARV